MVTKSSNTHYFYDQSGPRVALRVRSKRQDERNSTSSQRRRQKSWNLVGVRRVMRAHNVGVRKVMIARHLQGGGVGRVFVRRRLPKPPRMFGVF